MNKTILLCTVGGSHEPILTSIRRTKPDFICFVCSEKDPLTGRPGSGVQITGVGSVIRGHPNDDKPTLPNIPAQAQLDETQYEVMSVPTDDLDGAYITIRQRIRVLTEQYPEARFIADYTGGTKSMTAALVLAAVENEKVDLKLVTGPRTNLVGVKSGMETTALAGVEAIRTQRAVKQFIGAWQYFAYGEAAKGLAGIKPREPGLRQEVEMLQHLSRAFDAWDRFAHEQVVDIIDTYCKRIAPAHKHLLDSIRNLTTVSERQEPACLLDLWFNALRRAEQGRFDDAIARLYRLLEWTAQWILQVHCNIDTAAIPKDKIPTDMCIQPNRKGQYQAGLMNAWGLIGHWLPDSDAGRFSKQQLESLQDQITLRNHSILAHGNEPIDAQNWQKFKQWIEDNFLTLLTQEAKKAGLRSIPQQLPQRLWPEIDNL